jgi:predicted metal-binding membrane protein
VKAFLIWGSRTGLTPFVSDTRVNPGSNSPGRSLDKAVEGVVKRDKIVILIALSTVVVLSWAYILSGAGMSMSTSEMTRMILGEGETHIMTPAVWNPGYFVLMFFMWWIMMVAMMLPSATPMLLLFAAINRKQQGKGSSFTPTSIFVSAYLIVWAGFSIVAVVVQWGLQEVGFLSPMLESASVIIGGFILLAAGIYQLTPLKRACLNHCRSPLQFVLTRWRKGPSGAFLMGIEHGTFCVGCCWFLLCLLFFGGIMNLFWIAGLAVYILLEKTIPVGHWATNVVGIALIVWGITVLGYHSLA